MLGVKLTEAWGQPVVVENRPGSSGNLGADIVAKSAPDGYTFALMDVGNLVISPALYKLPFNIQTDFAPVAMVAYSPHLLVVSSKVPANTTAELIAYAKATYPHVKAGKIKLIAVSSNKRNAQLGDVPTVAETLPDFLPDFLTGSWQGLLAPAGTPKAIVDKVHAEVLRITAMPDVKERLVTLGAEPSGMSSNDFAKWMGREIPAMAKIVKEEKITVD